MYSKLSLIYAVKLHPECLQDGPESEEEALTDNHPGADSVPATSVSLEPPTPAPVRSMSYEPPYDPPSPVKTISCKPPAFITSIQTPVTSAGKLSSRHRHPPRLIYESPYLVNQPIRARHHPSPSPSRPRLRSAPPPRASLLPPTHIERHSPVMDSLTSASSQTGTIVPSKRKGEVHVPEEKGMPGIKKTRISPEEDETVGPATANSLRSSNHSTSSTLSFCIPSNATDQLRRLMDTFLREVDTHFGDRWQALLRNWFLLEAALDSPKSRRLLGAQHRPEVIGLWIKSRRKFTPSMTTVDLRRFANDFWRWWSGLQIDRALDQEGILIKNKNGMPQRQTGAQWDHMHVTGINGLLNIVAALYLWRKAESNSNLNRGKSQPHLDEWTCAVSDVTWAFEMTKKFI